MTSGLPSAKLTNDKKRPFNITEGPSQERKLKAVVPSTPAKGNCKHYDKLGHTTDECWRKVGACLCCGSREHRIPECPLLKENERRPNVRPRKRLTLKRTGMIKSEVKSTLDARDGLIDTLRAQLAGTEAQLMEAREAVATLRAAQATLELADAAGASTIRNVPDPKVASLREQLVSAVARAETVEHDLAAQPGELQSAITQVALTGAEVTELTHQLSELHTQVSQHEADVTSSLLWVSHLRLRSRRFHPSPTEGGGGERRILNNDAPTAPVVT
ncbi:hypothetical protein Taro_030531 [Colocasia esculenta]|uniref:Uncharacterized protein n=1 Tax=Colocasia esculenta TaxID=4460 RepID=A0A843VGK0_COLES|nr:hypothetical protein [Colocasia esculenta]